MKTTKYISVLLIAFVLGITSAISCKKVEPDKPNTPPTPPEQEDTLYHNITVLGESSLFKVEVADSAAPQEEVNIKITTLKEGVNILSALFNGEEATYDKTQGDITTFHFTMPDEDVEISVENSCDITLEDGYYFTVNSDKESAKYQEVINVTFSVTDPKYKIVRATFNNEECTFVEQDGEEYLYTFTMPDCPVTVTGVTEENQLIIERTWDENCVIVMLDCINNQGTPEEYCSQAPGELVHFIERHDLGFEVELSVKGIESGIDYSSEIFWSLAEDSHLYQDSWAFFMPEESVVINGSSTENNTYANEPFIGTYTGASICIGTNNIFSPTSHQMSLTLKASTAYSFVTTDENSYECEGLYTYAQNRFDYDIESCTNDTGIRGQFLNDDFIFIEAHYLIYDNVDNTRYYFGGKSDFEYSCVARDQYGTFFLIEANKDNQLFHFYLDVEKRTISAVNLEFEYGNSIIEDCSAKVFQNEELFLKYKYTQDETPTFIYKGKEFGSYTSENDGTLFLDGFGEGEYNGTKSPYTISGTIVTFGEGEEALQFNINLNNRTFSIINNSEGWGEYSVYSLNGAQISLSGTTSSNGVVTIRIDQNLMGNSKEGYAAIQIQYPGSFGRLSDMIADCQPYFYDASTSTLTITNVLQGTGSGYSSERKDVVLKVSSDGKSMTFVADYIYSTSSPYEYLFGGETNIITATE